MELTELVTRIDQFMAELKIELPRIADEIALNAIAMIKNRIIDRKEGLKGKAYSIKPMLATQDQFVVKSAFKQSIIEVDRILKNRSGKRVSSKSGRSYKTKKVKVKMWIKFPKASKAVPVMELERGYRQFREIQGRPGDHVNLSLTGKMWQGTTIVARLVNGWTYITVIGGNNEEAQNKLSWMTDKYGLFLTVNDEEQEVLKTIFDNRLQAVYDRVMLKAA